MATNAHSSKPVKMDIKWIVKDFRSLGLTELYAILQLRCEVFVVEQHCVYQDVDNKDPLSWHLMGWIDEQLVAYARIVPPGLSFDEPAIGRVVTSPAYRKHGIGKMLMQKAVEATQQLFPSLPIRIGAQVYLIKFYESLGFKPCSGIYPDDGIDHIQMILHS